jgi:hypothetical protein
MDTDLFSRVKSSRIVIGILFALGGYYCTFTTLNNHLIQYPVLPETLNVKVQSTLQNDSVVISYPIVSRLRPDSFRTKTATIATDTTKADTTEKSISATAPIYKTGYINTDPTCKINTTQTLFNTNPDMLIWMVLILLMMTVVSGSFPVFTANIFFLISTFRLKPGQIAVGVVCTLLILAMLSTNRSLNGYCQPDQIIGQLHILVSDPTIVENIVKANFVLVIPIILMMFLVAPAADNVVEGIESKESIEKSAEQLEYLNKLLLGALQLLSIIVVFSVLTSSSLRMSIKANFTIEGFDVFPANASYVYGLYFSLFLGIVYIPVYYYLRQKLDTLKKSVADLGDAEKEWGKGVLSLVKIDNTALDNIKLTLMVMSPFISSFLPETLHAFV